jgi:hypothetical protein
VSDFEAISSGLDSTATGRSLPGITAEALSTLGRRHGLPKAALDITLKPMSV